LKSRDKLEKAKTLTNEVSDGGINCNDTFHWP